ncbi:hypothetical protein AWH69_10820 [Janibacter melonis]|uniref:ArsA HSP20-like domain-containing protein n=1 Tax=Janibacter melonis TaxID=262209 RepID=A0A176QB44_9MICO|nr:Hsp20/alpha crystallin family protein [Janibacter melonis]OAB86896.1 hypothetical protein AWH69_10820 [Janibacter melonis]
MSALHLVTGGDEPRRRVLVADLVARRPGARVLTWGDESVHEDARDHAPAALAVLTTSAEDLLLAAELPGEVVRDLTAVLRDGDLLALLGAAAVLAGAPGEDLEDVVLLVPPGSDPARLVALPDRAARLARSLVPLVARWDAVVAPAGIGLPRPPAATIDALRAVAHLMDLLDARLCDDATVHHLPADGLVEAGRTAELALALALMGRRVADPTAAVDQAMDLARDGSRHDGLSPDASAAGAPDPDGSPAAAPGAAGAAGEGSPFVLRLPLPGLTARDITLEREDDDLVVTAGRRSRCTRLSPLHRRCRVVDASMRAGVLTVELEPDESVWPR